MPKLQTATLTNQNISVALLVGTFTAGAEYSSLMVNIMLDQIAGNGNYIAYLTHQLSGAGSAYPSALTTDAVPTGVTSHKFASILLPVNSGDVIKVYVTGLAGDTATPDITCEFWDLGYLRPATAGRTLAVASTGQVGIDYTNVNGSPSDTPGVTTLLTRIVGTLLAGSHNPQSGDSYARLGAPAGASQAADIAAIKAKTDLLPSSPAATGEAMTLTSGERTSIASAVWAATVRTLTAISDSSGVTTLLSRILGVLASGTHQPQSGDSYARIGPNGEGLTFLDNLIAQPVVAVSSTVAQAVSTGSLGLQTSYTLSQLISSNMTADLATATKLWLVIKFSISDPDTRALIVLEKTAGLIRVNRNSWASPLDGSLTVNGSSGNWNVAIHIDEAATANLAGMPGTYPAEVKALIGGDTYSVWGGNCIISEGVAQIYS